MDTKAFDIYEMTPDREKKIWNDCVFIFDSSALLDFYFSSKTAREDIYKSFFVPYKSRIWIPAHVQYEYLKNRKKVINKPISEQYEPLKTIVSAGIINAINKIENKITELCNQIKNKGTHPHFDNTEITIFQTQLKQFQLDSTTLSEAVIKHIEAAKKEIETLLENDDVFEAFKQHITVGRDFKYNETYKIILEGEHRYKYKIPPGYEDVDKMGTQVFGDLIIWKQILEYSIEAQKPIIFICNDLKEDWYNVDKSKREKEILGPREELLKEIYDISATEFWMYNLTQFLEKSKTYLGTTINETDIKNINIAIAANGPKPFLELDLVWTGSTRSPRGYSNRNPTEIDESGRLITAIGAGVKPIILWAMDWRFDLKIYNNSSFPAFNIKIENIGQVSFSHLEELNRINNIEPLGCLNLKAGFNQYVEDVHTVADNILSHKIPKSLEGLILRVTYLDELRNEHITIMKIEKNEVINVKG